MAGPPLRVEVVVAHYREPLDWLPLLGEVDTLTLYTKGGPDCPKVPVGDLLGFGLTRWEELPNIGREAGTYLHHIVTQWDALADITVFLQGEPRDHIPNLARAMCLLRAGAYPFFHPLIPVGEIYERAFQRQAPMQFTFGAGAQFAVARSVIRSKRLLWWDILKRIFESYPEDAGAAHAAERLWPLFFTEPL